MRRLLLMLQLLFAQFQTTWGEVVETLARNPGTSLEVLCESIWLWLAGEAGIKNWWIR